MEYCYHITGFITSSDLEKTFSNNISFIVEDKEPCLIVKIENASEREAYSIIERECDRIFFLTGQQLKPDYQWQKDVDGKKESCESLTVTHYNFHGKKKIPENITKQQWTLDLEVQLRLWRVANSFGLPIQSRINLLFQIIEISFPDRRDKSIYPEYTASKQKPASMTECKLLRDLVSHGMGTVEGEELKTYCDSLGVEGFYNLKDKNFEGVIRKRLHTIEREAEAIIKKQITYLE